MTDFNDFYWHDAVLLDLVIDRRAPGKRDLVKLLMLWPDDKISTIEFLNCYALEANMNFGMIALDSVLNAEWFSQSEELDKIRMKWKSINIDLSALNYYKIEMNSTASIIKVFALNFREIPHPELFLSSLILLGDTVTVKQNNPDPLRKGEIGSVYGMLIDASPEAIKQFNQKIGEEFYLVEFDDGETLEIPGSYLTKVNEA